MYRNFGITIMSFYLFRTSQTTFPLDDGYNYSENLTITIAVV